VNHALWGKTLSQQFNQVSGEPAFRGADSGSFPFVAIHVIDGNERRLTPHGQADVSRFQCLVDLVPDTVNPLPDFIRIRFGNAGIFMHA